MYDIFFINSDNIDSILSLFNINSSVLSEFQLYLSIIITNLFYIIFIYIIISIFIKIFTRIMRIL